MYTEMYNGMHVIDLCEKNTIEELVCLLLVLGDVGISVHPKHLRVRDDGKRLDILQVTFMLHMYMTLWRINNIYSHII